LCDPCVNRSLRASFKTYKDYMCNNFQRPLNMGTKIIKIRETKII
jgi:hypothetical protein